MSEATVTETISTATQSTGPRPGAMTPDDIWRVRQVGDPQVSPAGSVIAFTVTDPDRLSNRYRSQIWLAHTDPAAGQPYPFTGQGAESMPRWSPDGRRLAFVSSPPGEKKSEICILPVGAGGERVVVWSVYGGVSELEWSPDGSRLAFVAREPDPERYGKPGEKREGKDMPPRRVTHLRYRFNAAGWIVDRPNRIFVVPADGSAPPRSLTPGPYEAEHLTWSPDGDRIAFASARHDTWDLDNLCDLWVIAADGSSEPERLTDCDATYERPAWSPDGARLAYVLDRVPTESPSHNQVGVLDIATREHRVLTASLDRNCAPFGTGLGPIWAGDNLIFGVEDSGNTHVYQVAAAGTSSPALVVGGDRWLSEWDWGAGTLAFVAGTPVSTGELFSRPLTAGQSLPADAGQLADQETALTELTRPFADSVSLGRPQRFVARSADGSEVECWAIAPLGAQPGVRYPTLLNVHGGPFTQYGNRFLDEFQLEAAAGFGVLYCNPRGSAGYSEAWGRAIRWPGCENDPGSGWGGVDFEDVMACVDTACEEIDWVDPDRLGILGGSYGGYMTSWAIGHTDRFKAACSERACNNLITMEHNADIAGFLRTYVGSDHLTDPAAYIERSPVTYVKNMTTPVLIIHSEDDLRCPINQAEELFVALRLLGRNPVMIRFPDENHELSRRGAPAHRVARAKLILDWFTEHLQPGTED